MEKYLSFRQRDVELGHIVKGRHTTIATHLQHFLSFIGKDTKLKELERTDCENFFYNRHKGTNANVKQVTVQNELSKPTLLYHFQNTIELTDIADREVRDLVPYSLRHFMNTQRILSGFTFRPIADMCGTSVAQIERKYYHLNNEIRLTNAVADYRGE